MGTDATVRLEIETTRAGAATYLVWAEIHLKRDYVLFDLLAGGRSSDPTLAVVPVRPLRWPGADQVDPASTWLLAHEVEHVADVYAQRQQRESVELRAIAAAMHTLNGDHPKRTRLTVWFF